MKKLKLLDTFAGIGGFSYAAEKIVGGYETKQFIEINPFSKKILKKHWPNVPIHDDIKTFTAKPFQFDCISGGFPCQDISNAGLQKGITKNTRSGLFYELIRIIRMVRPRYVVLENVAAITNRGLDIVLRELYESGYDAEWSVISASALGACHQRARWWLVAYPISKQGSRTESEIQTRRNTTSSSFTSNTDSKRSQRRMLQFNEKLQETGHIGKKNTFSSTDSDSLRTQSHSSEQTQPIWQNAFFNSKERRTLSPNWKGYVSEPCLCRGDDGLRGRMDRLKVLGNAVVPQVAAIPMQRVLDLEKITN